MMTFIAYLTANSCVRDPWQLTRGWITARISSGHGRLILVELLPPVGSSFDHQRFTTAAEEPKWHHRVTCGESAWQPDRSSEETLTRVCAVVPRRASAERVLSQHCEHP